MKKVLLDANILLELLFQRARYEKVVGLLSSMQEVQFCASVLSIDIVMYFVEAEKQSKQAAWEFLSSYMTLDLTSRDTEWAHENDKGDYEDALQVACARRHGCNDVITLDKKMAGMYGGYISVETIR
jgi:predicted nucleic acid-binding protein